MSEKELIEGCLAQNRLAQKTFYDRYSRAMYTLAYRLTHDFDVANDVLQGAFLQAFRNMPTFRSNSTLGAWLKTIVIRTAFKHLKSIKTFDEITPSVSDTLIDWGDTLDAEYLEKAIQSLPDGFRTVFVLIEIEGYTHKEVGDMLGISEGTSKSQLFYAKQKLRKILKKYNGL
jgi:RNA polymerase sigma factor (sigma-70 family)